MNSWYLSLWTPITGEKDGGGGGEEKRGRIGRE